MLKRYFIPALIAILFFGCSDDKAQENALLDSVKKAHDKVMTDDGQVMKNKMQLKSLLASTAPGIKDSADMYSKRLDSTDNVMMDWMNKFNPDFTNKTHEKIMDYLKQQQKEISGLDTLLKSSVAASASFINKNKSK
jgi:dsDNA-binding SOS-regulon protein